MRKQSVPNVWRACSILLAINGLVFYPLICCTHSWGLGKEKEACLFLNHQFRLVWWVETIFPSIIFQGTAEYLKNYAWASLSLQKIKIKIQAFGGQSNNKITDFWSNRMTGNTLKDNTNIEKSMWINIKEIE